jgi:HD-like signal output (HDOD) protein
MLSTRMVRLVNSAFFGLQGKVASIRQAVVTIGYKGVRQLVLVTQVFAQFKGTEERDIRDLWRHSLFAAQWARSLAEERRMSEPEEAFTSALVHEIGRTIIVQNFTGEAAEIERLVKEGAPRAEAEKEAIGMTHEEVGGYLCDYWTFAPSLSQAVLYHHASPGYLRSLKRQLPLTGIVNAACRLADVRFDGKGEGSLEGLEDEFLQYHGLEGDTLLELAREVGEKARQMAGLLLS